MLHASWTQAKLPYTIICILTGVLWQLVRSFAMLFEGKPVPHDVYHRLRCVEEKILFLESLSPEYFCQNVS